MKTISVRELKAQWPQVESRVLQGETILVLNHGRPAARILPPGAREDVEWEDHLASAIPNRGKSAQDTVRADREGRW